MMRQSELAELVLSYNPKASEDALNRAYVFAMQAHGNQRRDSGDPYFTHPLEVAGILATMRMDTCSIVTALLHDTIEDTGTTRDDIQRHFGHEIADMVDGVTRISRMDLASGEDRQARNFRKFIIAAAGDVRVLLVKLADRLHNMRTLEFVSSPERRMRIATETMEIYAPIAARAGIEEWKNELQDLALRHLEPEKYEAITTWINNQEAGNSDALANVRTELEQAITEAGIQAQVTGRVKSPFSVWLKMSQKGLSQERITDLLGCRITVDTIPECYRALGVLHTRWQTVPGQFTDYISLPKRNGYRSLHTSLNGLGPQRLEIQIRTHEMHRKAEYGIAAHWRYRYDDAEPLPADGESMDWLHELVEITRDEDPEVLWEHTRKTMYHDQVFCFTPKGRVIGLPRGATPIDFACAVHTGVAESCVGVRINGVHKPLDTPLDNGDRVEILRGTPRTPPGEWLKIARSGRATSWIRRALRKKRRQEYMALGESRLEKLVARHGPLPESLMLPALRSLKLGSREELVLALGENRISEATLTDTLFPGQDFPSSPGGGTVPDETAATARPFLVPDQEINIRGLTPGIAVHYANCCRPLPGDSVRGIITDRGVDVHIASCQTLSQLRASPERWVPLSLAPDSPGNTLYTGALLVAMHNVPRALGIVTTVIGDGGGNISDLMLLQRSGDCYKFLVDVEITDLDHLLDIIRKVQALPVVFAAERRYGHERELHGI